MYFLCFSMYFCVLCIVCFVTFPVLFVYICVLNDCHQVATQLQLNIYHHHHHHHRTEARIKLIQSETTDKPLFVSHFHKVIRKDIKVNTVVLHLLTSVHVHKTGTHQQLCVCVTQVESYHEVHKQVKPFTDETQTALFKDAVRTAL